MNNRLMFVQREYDTYLLLIQWYAMTDKQSFGLQVDLVLHA